MNKIPACVFTGDAKCYLNPYSKLNRPRQYTMDSDLESTTIVVDYDGDDGGSSFDTGTTKPWGNLGYKSDELMNNLDDNGCNNINDPTLHQVDCASAHYTSARYSTAPSANQTNKSAKNKAVIILLATLLLLGGVSIFTVSISSSFWKSGNSSHDGGLGQHSIVVPHDDGDGSSFDSSHDEIGNGEDWREKNYGGPNSELYVDDDYDLFENNAAAAAAAPPAVDGEEERDGDFDELYPVEFDNEQQDENLDTFDEYNDVIDYIDFDAEAGGEGVWGGQEEENDMQLGSNLLPEDCDSPDCIMQQFSNATLSSYYGEQYEDNKEENNEEEEDSTDEQLSIFTGPISDFIVSNLTSLRAISSPQSQSTSTPSITNVGKSSSSNRCSNNQTPAQFRLDTDKYSWETSWQIKRTSNSKLFASGPPPNKNYARETRYVGIICLPPGRYQLIVNDKMGDGLCCTHGRGKVKLSLNGKTVAETRSGNDKFRVKTFGFTVPTSTGGENGSGNSGSVTVNYPPINNGKECSVVKPVDYNKKFERGSGYEGFSGTGGNFQCYRTVEGTRQTVNDLLTKYPSLTSKVTLGYPTAELKQRLYALVISNKRTNRYKGKMLVISSIHAREIATSELVTRFAEYLVQNYETDPEVKWILDYTEIHLIIHANPDGRKYLENGGEKDFWKKNRNKAGNCPHWRYGVDPNRNFPFKFGACDDSDGSQTCASSSDCQSTVYRGPGAQSEQETKAIVQYAASIFPASQRKGGVEISESKYNTPFAQNSEGVFIDVHSHGEDVGWPWGFKNQRTPNDAGLGALGRKMASYSSYELWSPKLPNRKYGFDGGTIDTMYGWLGAASFFYEIGTNFYQPCDTFPSIVNEVFPGLLYAAKVAREPYRASRGPDVLCTTISSNNKSDGRYISAQIQVSDNARTRHADDGGGLFNTGRQSIKSIEIFVNCHPYSGSSCQPRVRRNLSNAGKSKTVSIEFKAPNGRTNNVMYIRATDSANFKGPITARQF